MKRKQFWNNDTEALIAIMLVLVILGIINVFSSSFILSESDYDTPYFFLKRQVISLGIGLVAFLICFRIDYHKWRNWVPIVFILNFAALILVLIIGNEVNGAKRWLSIGPLSMQPAEIAKLVSIMMMAASLAYRINKNKIISLMNLQLGLIVLMAGFTEAEPDLGTACNIIGVPLIMMVVAGLERKHIVLLSAVACAVIAVLCYKQPYRLERIKVTWDPWSYAQDAGYQTVQSLSAIGSGEFWGMGLGVGVSKYEYLPEAHTDFAFAIFCQENGFIGAFFVFMLFAALTIYAARVSQRAMDVYGKILALGIMTLIIGQAVANLLMVSGTFPVVGVPLPFISYGGTSLIINMAAMGILTNIGSRSDRERRKQAEYEEVVEEVPAPTKKLHLVKK